MTQPSSIPAEVRLRAAWWTGGQRPLSGALRAVYYTGLAALLVVSSGSPVLMLETAFHAGGPELFDPVGLLAWTGLARIEHEALYVALEWVARALLISCVLSAVGFLGRLPQIVAGLSLALLQGVVHGSTGSGHAWFLPVYATLWLSLARTSDRWSVDALLAGRFSRYPRFNSGDGLCATGFARQCVLVATVALFFAAGASKLADGGLAWLDGSSLQTYIAERAAKNASRFAWLGAVLAHERLPCAVLSFLAIVLELGSIAALLSRFARHLLVSTWCVFHLVSDSILGVDFLPQAFVYVLLVDWEWFRGPAKRACASVTAATLGGAYGALLFMVALLQVEYWPLTHMPMFTSYVSDERVGSSPRSDFEDLDGLRRVAQACAGKECPWAIRNGIFRRRVGFKIASADGTEAVVPDQAWGQYPSARVRRLAADALLAGFASEPDAIDRFLERIDSLAARRIADAQAGDELQLFFRFDTGEVLVASRRLVNGGSR